MLECRYPIIWIIICSFVQLPSLKKTFEFQILSLHWHLLAMGQHLPPMPFHQSLSNAARIWCDLLLLCQTRNKAIELSRSHLWSAQIRTNVSDTEAWYNNYCFIQCRLQRIVKLWFVLIAQERFYVWLALWANALTQ